VEERTKGEIWLRFVGYLALAVLIVLALVGTVTVLEWFVFDEVYAAAGGGQGVILEGGDHLTVDCTGHLIMVGRLARHRLVLFCIPEGTPTPTVRPTLPPATPTQE